MRKEELIARAAKGSDVSKKEVTEIVERVFATIKHAVAKEKKFSYAGFGSLVLRKRKARDGRNPRTGDKLRIKASKSVGFRPSSAFKEAL